MPAPVKHNRVRAEARSLASVVNRCHSTARLSHKLVKVSVQADDGGVRKAYLWDVEVNISKVIGEARLVVTLIVESIFQFTKILICFNLLLRHILLLGNLHSAANNSI